CGARTTDRALGGSRGGKAHCSGSDRSSVTSSVTSCRSIGCGSTYGCGGGGGSGSGRGYWGTGHGLATPDTLANTPPQEFSTPSGSPMPSATVPGFGAVNFQEEWSLHGFGDVTGNGSETTPREAEPSARSGFGAEGPGRSGFGGGGVYAHRRHSQLCPTPTRTFFGLGEGGQQGSSLAQQQQQQSYGGSSSGAGRTSSGPQYHPRSEMLGRSRSSLDLGLDQYQDRQRGARWSSNNKNRNNNVDHETRQQHHEQLFFESEREEPPPRGSSSSGNTGGSSSCDVGASLFDGRLSSS
ncbi:unnamed protein product, partial [Laminaria digitata]